MKSNEESLAENMILHDLVPKMFSHQVLDDSETQMIDAETTTYKSVLTLISIMMQKNMNQCQQFIDDLIETGQIHLARLLGASE